MNHKEYFEQMRAHIDSGGTVTLAQRRALKAWESPVRHPEILGSVFDEDEDYDPIGMDSAWDDGEVKYE